MRVFNSLTGREIWKQDCGSTEVSDVVFNPDGRLIATSAGGINAGIPAEPHTALASNRADVVLWDADSGREIRRLPARTGGLSSPGLRVLTVYGIACSCFNSTVIIFDVATGSEFRVLRGHAGKISQIAYFPGGRGIVSVGALISKTVK